MATTNIWQQFKSLIPEGARTVVSITGNHGDGTSSATQQRNNEGWNEYQGSGRNDHAREKALIEDRVVKVEVPVMAVYEAEI